MTVGPFCVSECGPFCASECGPSCVSDCGPSCASIDNRIGEGIGNGLVYGRASALRMSVIS